MAGPSPTAGAAFPASSIGGARRGGREIDISLLIFTYFVSIIAHN